LQGQDAQNDGGDLPDGASRRPAADYRDGQKRKLLVTAKWFFRVKTSSDITVALLPEGHAVPSLNDSLTRQARKDATGCFRQQS
jgi:hypothetical protein